MKRALLLLALVACKKSAGETSEDEVKPVSVVCEPAQAGAAPQRGKINPDWLWFPFVALGGALALLAGVAVVRSRRGKRFMPRGRQSLPPLPPRVSGGPGA